MRVTVSTIWEPLLGAEVMPVPTLTRSILTIPAEVSTVLIRLVLLTTISTYLKSVSQERSSGGWVVLALSELWSGCRPQATTLGPGGPTPKVVHSYTWHRLSAGGRGYVYHPHCTVGKTEAQRD